MKKLISSFLLSLIPLTLGEATFAEEMHDHNAMHNNSSFSLNSPMQRDGSGTGWLPDSSPMYMYMWQKDSWGFMAHGSAFFRYNNQNILNTSADKRGGSNFDIPDWLMFSVHNKINDKNLISFRSMLSLDQLTMGGAGYPLLFQSGETWKGKELVDKQHPHDLFSELSLTYSFAPDKNNNFFVYLGLPGEPALGPTAFMHRLSAFNNPNAPLSHHLQDSTHIVFGVATLGYQYQNIKIDGSFFSGREPDENRFNIDLPKFDSYSARATVNIGSDFNLQASYGFIKEPEPVHPGIDVQRTTLSVLHNKMFDQNTNLASAFVIGINMPTGHVAQSSVLIESELEFYKNFLYLRGEYLQRRAEELAITSVNLEHLFNAFALTFGGSKTLFSFNKLDLNLGAQVTVNPIQKDLQDIYGNIPFSAQVFLRLFPEKMLHENNKIQEENMNHHMHEQKKEKPEHHHQMKHETKSETISLIGADSIEEACP